MDREEPEPENPGTEQEYFEGTSGRRRCTGVTRPLLGLALSGARVRAGKSRFLRLLSNLRFELWLTGLWFALLGDG